jgi:hypothetical protein
LGFAASGPGITKYAYLATAMIRQRSGGCMRDFSDSKRWYCQIETIYRPYEAHGTDTRQGYAAQDGLITGRDCFTPVNGYFDQGKGKTREMRFELTLGPSETWATAFSEPGMWAQTTVTSQTATGQSHIRRWDVVAAPGLEHHYMYIPDGKLHYNPTKFGDGDLACVENNVPLALTDATDDDLLADPPPGTPPSPPPPDPGHTVCGPMPDRCD